MTWSPSMRTRAVGLGIAGVGLVLAGLSLFVFMRGLNPVGAPPSIGDSVVPAYVEFAAPGLELRDLADQQAELADFRGRVVLVNLWATWCPPCKAEMPTLQEFHEQHRSQGFTVIAINDGESDQTVRHFVDQWGLTFPVWLDPRYLATEVAFRAAHLPTSYVIDRAGTVRLMWVGAIDKPTLEQYVLPLIEE